MANYTKIIVLLFSLFAIAAALPASTSTTKAPTTTTTVHTTAHTTPWKIEGGQEIPDLYQLIEQLAALDEVSLL